MRRFLPWLELRRVRVRDVFADIVAGLATTCLAVPQSVAYALIAGLPPIAGLYASVVPAIVGSLFRSSKFVVSGPTNAVSLLVGGAVGALADEYGAPPTQVAISMALMVGVMQTLAGLLRLGTVVDYISRSVVLGYITGAGVLIAIGQLHHVTGTSAGEGDVVSRVFGWSAGLGGLRWESVLVAGLTVIGVVTMRRLPGRIPAELVTLIIITIGVGWWGTDSGLTLVGDLAAVEGALPSLTTPSLFGGSLVAVALAATVLSLVESSSLARTISDRSGEQLDLSVEFSGQGLSNIAAALTGGYPVSGSLSRTALNCSAGARTRLSGVFAGLLVGGAVVVAGPLVNRVPVAGLAGLLMVVAVNLVSVSRIRQTFRSSRADALAFIVTLLGTWTLRLDHAIYLGVTISIVLFLRRARLLQSRELRVDDSGRLREVSHQQASSSSAVRVLHLEGSLFFGAAGELRDALLRAATKDVSVLVVRLKRTHGMDLTTAMVFASVGQILRAREQEMVLVGMRPEMMSLLMRSGAGDSIGEENLFPSRPGWFEAMDQGLRRALALSDAPPTDPLRAYLRHRASNANHEATAARATEKALPSE